MKRALLFCLVMILYAPLVFGLPGVKQYRAVWTANTEADLAGYYLYYRDVGDAFTDDNKISAGLDASVVLSGAVPTQTEIAVSVVLSGAVPTQTEIAVTAYDSSGNESGFSNVVFFDKDSQAPGVPAGLSIEEM